MSRLQPREYTLFILGLKGKAKLMECLAMTDENDDLEKLSKSTGRT